MRRFAALALALIACGPDGRDDGSGGGGGSGSGSGSGSGGGEDCSDAAKLVYVVDANKKLSRFDPMTKTFTDIGTLACPAGGAAQPFSMAVDRDTVAWVLYDDSKIYRVDTTSAACTATNWVTQGNMTQFGMGFSSNVAGSTDDTLFIAGGPDALFATTSELRTLNTQTMQSSVVGTVTGWPELTGTGNAELWGWFPDPFEPRVEQINKTNGAAIKTYMLDDLAGTPSAWAFAFWGGDFWIFLQKDSETSTTVYQIDGAAGGIKTMTPASGRRIVGAGVSTCAPTIIL